MQESSPEAPEVVASRTASVMATANIPRRIIGLVSAHVVIGLGAALVTHPVREDPTLRGLFLLGVVFSQTSLLGIWGGLGTSPWWKRLIGVVTGVSYLAPLLEFGAFEPGHVFSVQAVAATAFVAIPLLTARLFRIALRRRSPTVASAVHFQFSIRQLLILTFVVACLTTMATWAQPYRPHSRILYILVLCTTTFSGVGLLPVWLILATREPFLYSIGYVAAGFVAGYGFGCIALVRDGGLWAVTGGTEATALVVSLFVIRSCGYRVLRLPSRPRIAAQP